MDSYYWLVVCLVCNFHHFKVDTRYCLFKQSFYSTLASKKYQAPGVTYCSSLGCCTYEYCNQVEQVDASPSRTWYWWTCRYRCHSPWSQGRFKPSVLIVAVLCCLDSSPFFLPIDIEHTKLSVPMVYKDHGDWRSRQDGTTYFNILTCFTVKKMKTGRQNSGKT